MKNLKSRKLIMIALFVVFMSFFLFSLIPSTANAALVPCGRSADDPSTLHNETQMCTLCHFIVGFKGIMDYGFKIMVIVAIVMLVVSGIVYIISAGNSGMMETAKNLITNALIGFSIILGAWLIINTVIWVLGTRDGLGVNAINWYTFECK